MKENLALCKTSANGNKVPVVKSPILSQMNPVLSGLLCEDKLPKPQKSSWEDLKKATCVIEITSGIRVFFPFSLDPYSFYLIKSPL